MNELVEEKLAAPLRVVCPETFKEPLNVVAAFTLNGKEDVMEPPPGAKLNAVLNVLLLVCALGANCKARALLPLPASVNNQRQVGNGEFVTGANVLQSTASVVLPPPGP